MFLLCKMPFPITILLSQSYFELGNQTPLLSTLPPYFYLPSPPPNPSTMDPYLMPGHKPSLPPSVFPSHPVGPCLHSKKSPTVCSCSAWRDAMLERHWLCLILLLHAGRMSSIHTWHTFSQRCICTHTYIHTHGHWEDVIHMVISCRSEVSDEDQNVRYESSHQC